MIIIPENLKKNPLAWPFALLVAATVWLGTTLLAQVARNEAVSEKLQQNERDCSERMAEIYRWALDVTATVEKTKTIIENAKIENARLRNENARLSKKIKR